MGSARTPRHAPAPASLPPSDEQALLDQARSLQRAVAGGRGQALLRGKNLGLLCADDTQAQALLFRQAASELGAHVAHIGMSLSGHSTTQEVAHTARLLGGSTMQWNARAWTARWCGRWPTWRASPSTTGWPATSR